MLRSLGRCCLGKVDLSGSGGAVEVLPVPLSCPLPLLRTHPPSLLVCCFSFRRDGSNQYSIRMAGGNSIFVQEAVWKEPLWHTNPSFSCIGI